MAPSPWLPANALSDGVIEDHLRASCQAWGQHWLSRPENLNLRPRSAEGHPKLRASAIAWGARDASVAVVSYLEPQIELGLRMLQLERERSRLKSTDSILCRRLSAVALEDLARRLVISAGDESPVAALPPSAIGCLDETAELIFRLGFQQSSFGFDISLNRGAATTMRKSLVAAPPVTGPLGRMRDAIQRQPIRIGAIVGSSVLSLPEVSEISVGDVLMLESGPSEMLGLAVNGVRSGSSDLKLRRRGAAIELMRNDQQQGA